MSNTTRYVFGHRFKPEVFEAIKAVTVNKLRGKKYLNKRPKTAMRFLLDDNNSLTFKPEISSSPTGWKMGNKIRCELRKDITAMGVSGHGCYLILNLTSDGLIIPRRWKKDIDKTKEAFELVKDFLDKLATQPKKVIARNKNRCAICGRKFTDPESMARGIGPECVKMFEYFMQKVHGGNVSK